MDYFNATHSTDTVSRIKYALLDLLNTTSLSDINVSKVTDNANISRKTFYTYYHSIQELIEEIEDDIVSGLSQALKKDRQSLQEHTNISKVSEQELLELADYEFFETVNYCSYLKKFKSVFSKNGNLHLISKIRQISRDEFDQRLPFFFGMPADSLKNENLEYKVLPWDYLREIYVNNQVNILIYWITSEDSISKRELRRILGLMQVKSPMELISIDKK